MFMQLLLAAAPAGTATEPPVELSQRIQGYLDAGLDALVAWAPSAVIALVILFIGRMIAKILANVVRKLVVRTVKDETLAGFLRNIVYGALLAMVVIAALGQLGIPTTSFVAILGAVGLAIGFALQDSLGNLAAGVMIIFFRPFHTGDFVEAGGTTGVVEEVTIFATRLRTADNKVITVPNGQITGGVITNYSARDTRRVDMVFGIGYDDDIRAAKATLEKIIADDERVLADPAPVVALSELADSSVNFVVRPWVKSADYWAVLWDTNEKVKLAFDQAGISIPYPQQDVHVKAMPAA